MKVRREKILLVENDAAISDVIARQALRPLGYQVDIVLHASAALQEVARLKPDLILANLNLPGLSGKDLLVALSSQGYTIPVIVLAEDTEEGDILQAFRLGAADFLRWPARETEVVTIVERVLKLVRDRQERQALMDQLTRLNQELEQRVNDLTTLVNTGKKVIVLTNPKQLFQVGLIGAMRLGRADRGMIVMRAEDRKDFYLRAAENMPADVNSQLNHLWDDGVSNLVAESAQPLAIHGEPLKPFILSKYGKAVLLVPIRAKTETMGVMILLRQQPQAFDTHTQMMIEAVADYTAIAFVNIRLMYALEKRSKKRLPEEGTLTPTQLKTCQQVAFQAAEILETLLLEDGTLLTGRQRQALNHIQERLQYLLSQMPIT